MADLDCPKCGASCFLGVCQSCGWKQDDPTPEIDEARRLAKLYAGRGRNHVAILARGFTALDDLLGKQSEREKALREAVGIELGRHLCYTSDHSRERFWKQVDDRLAPLPEQSEVERGSGPNLPPITSSNPKAKREVADAD